MATYSMEEDYLPFALIGLEHRRDEIDTKIAEIRQLLGRPGATAKAPAPAPPAASKRGRKRRTMSPEARARIAEAQRARWANTKGNAAKGTAKKSSGKATSEAKAPAKAKAAAKTKGTPKRTMSPEARERIAEAQRKRWAASRKEG